MTEFALKKETDLPFEEALKKVPEALAEEGFGVLTEIDVKATLKKKLDADFRDYRILGACNPRAAHRALGEELDVGVMMPCNVVVYARDDGRATVLAVDPMQTMASQAGEALREVAEGVRKGLARALDRL
ncbi:MAG: DUF302 domain-containing protein [Myxococcota bacterium]